MILVAAAGCATKATFTVTHEPRFTTCQGPPGGKVGYPVTSFASVTSSAAAQCRGVISGEDGLYTYTKDDPVQPDEIAVQYVALTGTVRKWREKCGDTPATIVARVVE